MKKKEETIKCMKRSQIRSQIENDEEETNKQKLRIQPPTVKKSS